MKNKANRNFPFRVLIFFIITPILWLMPHEVLAQQDIQFSQYVFNGMALNPAYAGYKEATNYHFVYRDQWTGLVGAPKTSSFSMDGVTEDQKIGLGGMIIQDELGAQSSLEAVGVFSYRLRVGERSRLSFGLGAGVDQYKIDGTKLFSVQTETALGSLQSSLIQPTLNFGVFYATPQYFAAFSVNDLFSGFQGSDPAYLVIYRNRHYYLQGGALFPITQDIVIKPSILIKEDFLGPTNLDMNLFFLISDKVWLGGSYRTGVKLFNQSNLQSDLSNKDAYSVMLEFFISDQLRIGYSFDYTTSLLKDVNSGTHEISIGYTMKRRKAPMLSPRYF
jgi:type IX secretion system PorP/SprF family membrane protein